MAMGSPATGICKSVDDIVTCPTFVGQFTVTVTGEEARPVLFASVVFATAVNTSVPAVTLCQLKVKGAFVAVPTSVPLA